MNKDTAKMLIQKFHDGTLSDAENDSLEKYIENDWIQLEELNDLNAIHKNLILEESAVPINELRSVFYENLEKEKQNTSPKKSNWWNQLFTSNLANANWGFGLAALLVGLLLGNLFQTNSSNPELEILAKELQKTQETMMVALLEKESSRDRLKAVKISQEMDDVSNKIIQMLLTTLNTDGNVNVRLAAIETLADYSKNPIVREGLVKAIQNQESPMVQLALAELMVFLQDKRSVNEFKELMQKKEIPTEIKDQLEEKIKVLL